MRPLALRARLTLVATGLVAVAGALLLLLVWLLVGDLDSSLPGGEPVVVDGVLTDAAVVAASMRTDAQQEVLLRGAVALVLLVVAAGLASWALAGRALRPLQEVTAAARRLSQDNLDERIHLDGPRDEVRQLAETFDAMLDRLQAAFAAQQRFVADASHELRTPLAVMRTEVDVSLADPHADAAELRRMGEVLRAATDRAESMIAGLLVVARTTATGLDRRDDVDVAELVPGCLHSVRDEVARRRLTVTCDVRPLHTRGDPVLLERVVGNLVENAVRHNVDGGWVRVACGDEGVVVTSSGPVVDDAAVAGLFEPFHRGGAARTAHRGSGLGLAIVSAVMAAHGGSVSAEPVDSGGLSVRVQLPPLA